MPKSADGATPFVATLQEINGGASLLELSDALIAVVDAVRRTGKKGTLTYTLTVKPASAGDVDTLFLADDVKLKMPSLQRKSTVMFADADNLLSRSDPRQPELAGLKTVADVATFPKEVAQR